MFKHVLVPLDGSELSEKALAPARQVLSPEGTLTLLSVIDLPDVSLMRMYDMPLTDRAENREDEVTTARKNVQAYLRRIVAEQHLPPTMAVQIKVCVGDPASIITGLARALGVETIVMSTHGRSGLSRWMFGSITQRVLAVATCPVVVVPGQQTVPAQYTQPQAVPTPAS
jgi:nucleotide-binding universal stress UspA family protein